MTEHDVLYCPDLAVRFRIDSADAMEILVGLEVECGVQIDPVDVTMTDFCTVSALLAWYGKRPPTVNPRL